MKYIGIENFPPAVRAAIENDTYSRGDADISVTQLIDAPQIKRLQETHASELSSDCRRAIAPLIGTAVHSYLQRYTPHGQMVAEERLFAVCDGITISGAMDLQTVVADNNGSSQVEVSISDYKVVSASSLSFDKPLHEAQLNVYAWLCRANGKRVCDLNIISIIKDWSERKSKEDASYPLSPIIEIRIPLWSSEVLEAYVRERVRLHKMKDPPPCTDKERWYNKYRGSIRCIDNWCGVREFCQQGKEELSNYEQGNKASDRGRRATAIFPEIKHSPAPEQRPGQGGLHPEGEEAGNAVLDRKPRRRNRKGAPASGGAAGTLLPDKDGA